MTAEVAEDPIETPRLCVLCGLLHMPIETSRVRRANRILAERAGRARGAPRARTLAIARLRRSNAASSRYEPTSTRVDTLAARAGGPAPDRPARRFHPAAVHGVRRDPRRPPVCRRPRADDRFADYGAARAHRRAPEGRRYQKRSSQLRVARRKATARRCGDATGEKFKPAIMCLRGHACGLSGIESEERGVAEAIAREHSRHDVLDTPPSSSSSAAKAARRRAWHRGRRPRPDAEFAIYRRYAARGLRGHLWRDPPEKVAAADALKLTAPDLLKAGSSTRSSHRTGGGAQTGPGTAALQVDAGAARGPQQVAGARFRRRLARRYDKFRGLGGGGRFVDSST